MKQRVLVRLAAASGASAQTFLLTALLLASRASESVRNPVPAGLTELAAIWPKPRPLADTLG